MFIPLFDINNRGSDITFTPFMTLIIISNIIVFVYQSFLIPDIQAFFREWGVVPLKILKANEIISDIPYYPYITLVTYSFIHANFWHILGNMWFFFIFGNDVEARMRPIIFLLFYLGGAIIAAIFQILYATNWNLNIENAYSNKALLASLSTPLVGASGAVSAVLGAYLRYFPEAEIATLILFFFINIIPISAIWYIGGWFVYQVINALANPQSSVAWIAHIAGFVYGYLFASVYKGKEEY
jgi:membrane associated rhomboid family serine protease